MKRQNRIVSAIVLVCFLFNTAVSDLAFAQVPNYRANSDTLAVPSKLANLIDGQHKDMAIAEIILQAHIKDRFPNAVSLSVDDVKSLNAYPALQSNTDVQFFFSRPTVIGNGFVVKCRVGRGMDRNIYYAIFSSKKNGLGGHDINIYTEKEYEGLKDQLKSFENAPKRDGADALAIEVYIENEKRQDALLGWAHANGRTAVPNPDRFDFKDALPELLKLLNVEIRNPNKLREIAKRDFVLVKDDAEFKKERTRLDAWTVDVVLENHGFTGVVWNAHSSNKAIHIIVSEEDFNILTGNGLVTDQTKIDAAIERLKPTIAKEVGAITRRPWETSPGPGPASVYNDIADRYANSDLRKTKLTATVVDLDHLIHIDPATQRPIHRDYAAGPAVEHVTGTGGGGVLKAEPDKPYWAEMKKGEVKADAKLAEALSGFGRKTPVSRAWKSQTGYIIVSDSEHWLVLLDSNAKVMKGWERVDIAEGYLFNEQYVVGISRNPVTSTPDNKMATFYTVASGKQIGNSHHLMPEYDYSLNGQNLVATPIRGGSQSFYDIEARRYISTEITDSIRRDVITRSRGRFTDKVNLQFRITTFNGNEAIEVFGQEGGFYMDLGLYRPFRSSIIMPYEAVRVEHKTGEAAIAAAKKIVAELKQKVERAASKLSVATNSMYNPAALVGEAEGMLSKRGIKEAVITLTSCRQLVSNITEDKTSDPDNVKPKLMSLLNDAIANLNNIMIFEWLSTRLIAADSPWYFVGSEESLFIRKLGSTDSKNHNIRVEDGNLCLSCLLGIIASVYSSLTFAGSKTELYLANAPTTKYGKYALRGVGITKDGTVRLIVSREFLDHLKANAEKNAGPNDSPFGLIAVDDQTSMGTLENKMLLYPESAETKPVSMAAAARTSRDRSASAGQDTAEVAPKVDQFEEFATADQLRVALASARYFDTIFGSSRYNGSRSALGAIFSKIEKTFSSVRAEFKGRDKIEHNKILVVHGDYKGTMAVQINFQESRRVLYVYQSFIEGLYELTKLIDTKDQTRAAKQQDVISAIIDSGLRHEMGHGYDLEAGMDLHTLMREENWDKVKEYAPLFDIGVPEKYDREVATQVAEAMAEMGIGGGGDRHYVRNKAAYIFFKYVLPDYKDYIDKAHGNAILSDKITALVKKYYEVNPHLRTMVTGGDLTQRINDVAAQVVEDFGLFYDNAAMSGGTNGTSGQAFPATKEDKARVPVILQLIRTSYTSRNDGDRAAARTALVRGLHNGELDWAIEQASVMLSQTDNHSSEERMLKATLQALRDAQTRHHGSASAAAGQGTAENDPRVSGRARSVEVPSAAASELEAVYTLLNLDTGVERFITDLLDAVGDVQPGDVLEAGYAPYEGTKGLALLAHKSQSKNKKTLTCVAVMPDGHMVRGMSKDIGIDDIWLRAGGKVRIRTKGTKDPDIYAEILLSDLAAPALKKAASAAQTREPVRRFDRNDYVQYIAVAMVVVSLSPTIQKLLKDQGHFNVRDYIEGFAEVCDMIPGFSNRDQITYDIARKDLTAAKDDALLNFNTYSFMRNTEIAPTNLLGKTTIESIIRYNEGANHLTNDDFLEFNNNYMLSIAYEMVNPAAERRDRDERIAMRLFMIIAHACIDADTVSKTAGHQMQILASRIRTEDMCKNMSREISNMRRQNAVSVGSRTSVVIEELKKIINRRIAQIRSKTRQGGAGRITGNRARGENFRGQSSFELNMDQQAQLRPSRGLAAPVHYVSDGDDTMANRGGAADAPGTAKFVVSLIAKYAGAKIVSSVLQGFKDMSAGTPDIMRKDLRQANTASILTEIRNEIDGIGNEATLRAIVDGAMSLKPMFDAGITILEFNKAVDECLEIVRGRLNSIDAAKATGPTIIQTTSESQRPEGASPWMGNIGAGEYAAAAGAAYSAGGPIANEPNRTAGDVAAGEAMDETSLAVVENIVQLADSYRAAFVVRAGERTDGFAPANPQRLTNAGMAFSTAVESVQDVRIIDAIILRISKSVKGYAIGDGSDRAMAAENCLRVLGERKVFLEGISGPGVIVGKRFSADEPVAAESNRAAGDFTAAISDDKMAIAELMKSAERVGKELSTDYKLLVTMSFFNNGEELKKDQSEYMYTCKLEGISGIDQDQRYRSIINKAAGNWNTSIVLLSKDELNPEQILSLRELGVRVILTNDVQLIKAKEDTANREEFKKTTYLILRLLRQIDAASKDSPLYNMAKYYLKTHFGFEEPIALDAYIDAIIADNSNIDVLAETVKILIKGFLKYRPVVAIDAESDYKNLTETLMAA